MGKLLLAFAVAVACFITAESLTCNKCSFGLLGMCLNAANETCTFVNSTCSTLRASFPSVTNFPGFNVQGCAPNNTGCGEVLTSTFLSVPYTYSYTCCSTDRCNTVTISAAPSSKMALSAALGASILAVMFSM